MTANVELPENQNLTPTETTVLRLLSGGGSPSNKVIAAQLRCSERTVDAHLRSVSKKLGISGRVGLAVWAAHHLPAEQVAA
ncbi:response regulator transcription factor [Azospirillum sp. sgz302134]